MRLFNCNLNLFYDWGRWLFRKKGQRKFSLKRVIIFLIIILLLIIWQHKRIFNITAAIKATFSPVETIPMQNDNLEDEYKNSTLMEFSPIGTQEAKQESTTKNTYPPIEQVPAERIPENFNTFMTNSTLNKENIGSSPVSRQHSLNKFSLKTEKGREYPQKVIVFDESGKDKAVLEEGTIIPVIMISSIVMKDTKAPVRFKIIEDVYDDAGNLVITDGSIAFGTFGAFNDQGRAFGKIRKIKITGEKLKTIEAEILSADESYGLSGFYYDEKGKYIAGSLITTFLGGFAEGYQSKMVTEIGSKVAQYSTGSLKNAFLNALEKTALTEANREAERLKDVKPFLVIPEGTPALLMVGNIMEGDK